VQNKCIDYMEITIEDVDREIIQSIVELIDQLPALPIVVQRILQVIEQENTTTKEIADLISLDPALSARLLSLVNSAYYSCSVSTIQHAVALLGFSEVKNLTIGLKVMETLSAVEFGSLDPDLFWEHSLACGLCARNLAKHVSQVKPDEAFLGGLLHDIGKMVFGAYLEDRWNAVQKRAEAEGHSPLVLENKLIGVAHTTVGKWLARHWKIPVLHQLAIQYHHALPEEAEDLNHQEQKYCAIIYAANILVRCMNLGSSGYSLLRPVPTQILALLVQDDPHVFEESIDKTLCELTEWKKTLGIPDKGTALAEVSGPGPDSPHESPSLLVICPEKNRIPSLQTLLKTLGYRVHTSCFGEKFLPLLAQDKHQAFVIDLRGMMVDTQKLITSLQSARSQSTAPILLLADNNKLVLSPSLEGQNIHCLQGFQPHREALHQWLQTVLPL